MARKQTGIAVERKLILTKLAVILCLLPYSKALAIIKSLAYTRIDHNYYISESKLQAFLSQKEAVELRTTKEDDEF